MNETVQRAVNEQIQAEFASAYLYLSMAARFNSMNLSGFAHWLRLQWEEETQHALKFYDFLLRRGGTVDLLEIPKPDARFESPQDAFEQVLAHERHITGRIHDLYELASEERDYALQSLLQWFIDEQVEEEEQAEAILDSLRMTGGTGPALFFLDRELGQRRPDSGA